MKKHYLLFLLIISLSWGCAKYRPDLSNQVTFKAFPQDNFYSGKSNFDVILPLSIINQSDLINKGKVFFDNRSNFGGIPMKFFWNDPIFIQNPEKNRLLVKLPISWEAEPNIMGVSVGKISGANIVELNAEIGIKKGEVDMKIFDYGYSWINKPSVKVLGMNLNIASSIDSYLKSNKKSVLRELNESTQKVFNQEDFNRLSLKYFEKLSLKNKEIEVKIDQFFIESLLVANSNLAFKGSLQGGIYFGVFNQTQKIKPIEGFPIYLKIPFYQIEKKLEGLLYTKKPAVKIHFSQVEGRLVCKILNYFGQKSEIVFELIPVINHKSLQFFPKNIQINHVGLGRVGAKSAIENKIGRTISSLEFSLEEVLKTQATKNTYLNMNLINQDYRIVEIYLNEFSIGGLILLNDSIYFKNY